MALAADPTPDGMPVRNSISQDTVVHRWYEPQPWPFIAIPKGPPREA